MMMSFPPPAPYSRQPGMFRLVTSRDSRVYFELLPQGFNYSGKGGKDAASWRVSLVSCRLRDAPKSMRVIVAGAAAFAGKLIESGCQLSVRDAVVNFILPDARLNSALFR